MSQVSRRFLKKDIEDRITKILEEALVSCSTTSEASEFIEDLLTPTEKIMLAKRLAISFLLIKGYTYSSIESTLKVSDSTVGFVALQLKHKGTGLRKIIHKLYKKQQWRNFLDDLGEAAVEIFGSSKLVHNKNLKSFKYNRQTQKAPF
ncbi:hypothetical protein HY407_00970 [Candidatus Gottesmanbacteria bacterium]|nr:hypothetical protein [Candidatus Gottesmanbacteria bacterium]